MRASKSLKKSTHLSLDGALLTEARALKINLSRAAEKGLRREITRAKSERWQAKNAAAIKSSNRWSWYHGLPLVSLWDVL